MRLQKMLFKALVPDYKELRRVKLDLAYRDDGKEACTVWLWNANGNIIDHYIYEDISNITYKDFTEKVVKRFEQRRINETTES